MRLTWFEARELRRFQQGVRIENFDSGINVFCGPNGTGKSSIIRALRAAFFERYQTKTVTDLLPWTNPGAHPAVEVHFEHDGVNFELRKQFLKSPFAMLIRNGVRLENTLADDALADLFGFSHGSKGRSKPEHWGVPGLLWIEQGQGQDIDQPVAGAGRYLRDALAQNIGDMTSSDGDAILNRLRSHRNELLAINTNKPKGEFDKALHELQNLDQQVLALQEQRDRYRSMVDRLGELQQVQREANATRPWEQFAQQIADARKAVSEGQALRNRRANLLADQERLTAEQLLAQSRLQAWSLQDKQLAERQDLLARAAAELAEAERYSEVVETKFVALNSQLTDARQRYEYWRDQEEVRQAADQLRAVEQALRVSEQQLSSAGELQSRIEQIHLKVSRHDVEPADLQRLRDFEQVLQRRDARRDALSTQLEWHLCPGRQVVLNDETLTGHGAQALSSASCLTMPGIGELRIRPGKTEDLASDDEANHATAQIGRLLAHHQVASAAELEQQLADRLQDQQELKLLTAHLNRIAPDGLQALTNALLSQRSSAERLRERLAGSASQDGKIGRSRDFSQVVPDSAQGQQAQQAALQQIQTEFGRLTQLRNQAMSELATRRANKVAAANELDSIMALVNEPGRAEALRQESDRESLAASQLQSVIRQLANIDDQISQLNLSGIEQDIERLTRSLRATRDAFEQNEAQCRLLEGRLSEAGATGVEEQLAGLQAHQARLQRRVNQFQRQAQALNLLVARLEAARQDATEQLQAPLRRHLNHYLRLLFPAASLTLTDNLSPSELRLDGDSIAQSGQFAAQSFGTREQLALVSRLAYADLLQLAGLPTLIILDDGLVHTDPERLSRMKRILFDAAKRHQILIFTCHENRWLDMGTSPRDIRSLPPASRTAVDAA